jgi:hypothetical protein
MNFATESFEYNHSDNISGWDEVREFKVTVKNTRDIAVKVEITRNFGTPYWDIEESGDFDEYEKVDKATVKFTLELKPKSVREFKYELTTYHGTRRE